MYKKEYKLILFINVLLLILNLNGICAESGSVSDRTLLDNTIKIDELERSWFTVLSGSPSSEPFQTNYGFLIVEDGKFLSSYSRSGQRLWQTNCGAKIKNIAVSETEFISVINQKNQLMLVNPSGLILWTSPLSFTPTSAAISGFDGRLFVRSLDQIAAFGINGSQKWELKTEQQSPLSPELLNDGSLIVFLEKTHEGKTCAVRVSPFGNILEEIVFQGKVINAFSSGPGIILVFSTGQIGMCSIGAPSENTGVSVNADSKEEVKKHYGLIYSKWINKEVNCNQYSRSRKLKENRYAVFTPGYSLIILNAEKGTVEKSFTVPEITSQNYLYFEAVDDKLIIAQENAAVIYNTQGKRVKNILMPSKNGKYGWEYSCFINSGYFTYLSKNWTVNSFKIISTSKENESSVFAYHQNRNMISGYKNYVKNLDYRPEKNTIGQEVYRTVKAGNMGSKEITISNNLNTIINSYYQQKNTQTFNRDDYYLITTEYNMVDMENALRLIPLMQSHFFQQKLALLLSVETDSTMIIKILRAVSECGYDPGGEILSEIEQLIRHTNPKDKAVLNEAANAVYEICRFMGRPALLSKGKEILSGMFYPQYDESTKRSVRSVMQKLADLHM